MCCVCLCVSVCLCVCVSLCVFLCLFRGSAALMRSLSPDTHRRRATPWSVSCWCASSPRTRTRRQRYSPGTCVVCVCTRPFPMINRAGPIAYQHHPHKSTNQPTKQTTRSFPRLRDLPPQGLEALRARVASLSTDEPSLQQFLRQHAPPPAAPAAPNPYYSSSSSR